MLSTAKKSKSSRYVPARTRMKLTPGDSVRIARELQELTQSELAAACEMPQATISSIERGRVVLGAARAEKFEVDPLVHTI